MATLNEIAMDLINAVRGGRSSDDEHISVQQAYWLVHQYRARLIKQELDKGLEINNSFEQTIECEVLLEVDRSSCPAVLVGCTVKRTTNEIPHFVRTKKGDAISFIGSIDQQADIQIVTPHAARWNKYNTYTSKRPKAYQIGKYIYVDDQCGLERISIRGVFEDPTELETFGCYDADSEYPMPADLIPVLISEILRLEFGILPEAKNNDMSNDKVQN